MYTVIPISAHNSFRAHPALYFRQFKMSGHDKEKDKWKPQDFTQSQSSQFWPHEYVPCFLQVSPWRATSPCVSNLIMFENIAMFYQNSQKLNLHNFKAIIHWFKSIIWPIYHIMQCVWFYLYCRDMNHKGLFMESTQPETSDSTLVWLTYYLGFESFWSLWLSDMEYCFLGAWRFSEQPNCCKWLRTAAASQRQTLTTFLCVLKVKGYN